MLRPGYIQPLKGVKSKTPLYQGVYNVLGWIYPALHALLPRYTTTTVALARAMVGDLQRIKVYAETGFQIPQEIPADVWSAYDELVALGYDQRLAADRPRIDTDHTDLRRAAEQRGTTRRGDG